MRLKITYKYNGEPMELEIPCSNYTFGLPMLYIKFEEKHNASLDELIKNGTVTDNVILSFYNDQWRVLKSASLHFG